MLLLLLWIFISFLSGTCGDGCDWRSPLSKPTEFQLNNKSRGRTNCDSHRKLKFIHNTFDDLQLSFVTFYDRAMNLWQVKHTHTHKSISDMDHIAQHRGVPGLSAVKLSISTVWKSGCTVCSPSPSLYASLHPEKGCRGQLALWGAEDSGASSLSALDTEVWRSRQTESWLERERGRVGEGGGCESTHKGQVSWLLLFQWATTWRLKG